MPQICHPSIPPRPAARPIILIQRLADWWHQQIIDQQPSTVQTNTNNNSEPSNEWELVGEKAPNTQHPAKNGTATSCHSMPKLLEQMVNNEYQ
jgi:hypothetical protein